VCLCIVLEVHLPRAMFYSKIQLYQLKPHQRLFLINKQTQWQQFIPKFSHELFYVDVIVVNFSTGMSYLQNRFSIQTWLWKWKPFCCATSQFAVNNFWSVRNTNNVTPHFPSLMCRHHYLSATSNYRKTVFTRIT